jgi:hypothetical protein
MVLALEALGMILAATLQVDGRISIVTLVLYIRIIKSTLEKPSGESCEALENI